MSFKVLDIDLNRSKIKSPKIRLYKNTQIDNLCLFKRQPPGNLQYQLIELYEYRNLQKLKQQYPDSDIEGYLNLRFRCPFKASEILTKYIIENNIQFQPPEHYTSIFYHIMESCIYCEIINSIQCNYNKKIVFAVYETQIDDQIQYDEIISGDWQSLVNSFVELIGQQQHQNVVFMIGNQMNTSKNNLFLKTLRNNGIYCQTSEKKGKTKDHTIMKQITNLPEFQNTYFVDMQIPHYSESIIDFQQLVNDYIINRDLEIILKKMEYLEIPLSFALYETNANNLQFLTMRRYFENDYMFLYNSTTIQKQKIKTIGGLYEQASDEFQTTVLQNIAEGDFYSLYASIIVDKNISYETIHKRTINTEANLLNSSIPAEQLIWDKYSIYIDKEQGVIPKLTEQLLNVRKSLSNDQIIDKQALKQILVNIYGNFGTEHLTVYNPLCLNIIVEYSRLICTIAKQGLEMFKLCEQVIQQQTDSCMFQPMNNMNPFSKQFKQSWHRLNQYINSEIGSNRQLFNFKFEYEKFAKYMIISKAKNTQVSYVFDFKDKSPIYCERMVDSKQIQKNQNSCKIQLKGDLRSSKYSKYKLSVIESYFKSLFESAKYVNVKLNIQMNCECNATQNAGYHSNNFCYFSIFDREKNILLELINSNAIKQIVENYGTYLFYSQDDSLCQYLNVNYGVLKSCKYLFHGEKIIPETALTIHNIRELRVDQIIADLLRPIKSILTAQQIEPANDVSLYNKGFNEQIQAYGKIQDLQELPRQNECLLRVETVGRKQFVVQDFDEIQYLIESNPATSFHEVIYKNLNKMYFDIDSKTPIDEPAILKSVQFVLAKLVHVKISPKIHRCSANSKSQKFSYHIIIDIACTKELNILLAKQMNQKYIQLTKSDINIFDIGVYKGINQSLRLPLCVKISKDCKIDKRPFQITSDSVFRDFIISDTKQCILYFDNIIHFDKQHPIDPARFCDKYAGFQLEQLTILQQLSDLSNTPITQWQIKDKRIISSCPYKCPVCSHIHDQDNLYLKIQKDQQLVLVNCFSNKQRKDNKFKYLELINFKDRSQKTYKQTFQQLYDTISENNTFLPIATQLLNQQHISFDIINSTTYIISDMGTGKSQQIVRFLQSYREQNPTTSILCLSFRRTFSIEFSTKYGLENYMDIKGRLDLSKRKRLIIQVDSLTRCDITIAPDILIIDEIESILERIYQCQNDSEVSSKFLKLIQCAKNVVYMDGLIERKTIEYLNLFREVKHSDIILNQYSPRKDYTYLILPLKKNQKNVVLDYFLQMIKQGKKVYGMVTSKTLGFYIQEQISKILPHKKVIFYHGSDQRDQEDITTTDLSELYSSHIQVKKKHFKNVNLHWSAYDLVIHNSAITAGVSFDGSHFDIQINVYGSLTTTPLSFFQGCHRVRHLKNKLVVTFLHEEYIQSSLTTPFDIFNRELEIDRQIDISTNFDFNKQKQFQLWLNARFECTKKFYKNILFKYLKRMNYHVIFKVSDIPHYIDSFIKHAFSQISMQGETVDLQQTYFEKLHQTHIESADQQLYDDVFRCNKQKQSGVNSCQQVYYKMEKLQLAKLFQIPFADINNMSINQLKLLDKNKGAQEFRNIIKSAFLNNIDPQQDKFWILNTINNFRTLRNNNRSNDSKSYLYIRLLNLVLQLNYKYDDKPFELQNLIDDLKNVNKALKESRIAMYIYNSKNIKERLVIDQLNQFFNLFFLELKINTQQDNQRVLSVSTISKSIFEYITNYDANAVQQNDLNQIIKPPRKSSFDTESSPLE